MILTSVLFRYDPDISCVFLQARPCGIRTTPSPRGAASLPSTSSPPRPRSTPACHPSSCPTTSAPPSTSPTTDTPSWSSSTTPMTDPVRIGAKIVVDVFLLFTLRKRLRRHTECMSNLFSTKNDNLILALMRLTGEYRTSTSLNALKRAYEATL